MESSLAQKDLEVLVGGRLDTTQPWHSQLRKDWKVNDLKGKNSNKYLGALSRGSA